MRVMKSLSGTTGLLAVALVSTGLLAACDNVPGTEAWCDKMLETDKTTWSVEDAKTFAEDCVAEPVKEDLEDMKDNLPQ